MKTINQDSLINIHFELKWNSPRAIHTECYEAIGVNTWRDFIPPSVLAGLEGKSAGEKVTVNIEPGMIIPEYESRKMFSIKEKQFNKRFFADRIIQPRTGRFYPRGILNGVTGVYPQNLYPFRCAGIENGKIYVDFNHPLSKTAVQLTALIKKVKSSSNISGGRSHAWGEIITDGPGMQVQWEDAPTQFFLDDPFQRIDSSQDSYFYKRPRLVQHIDDAAIKAVKNLYGQLLKSGMRVLDLMSSWQSHIPDNVYLKELTGLGLNREELERNDLLDKWFVHDLNLHRILPFKNNEFDAAICTVSIEYIIYPDDIFHELSRVLRPGGVLIIAFSNRWFPPKAIQIWKDLHEFERMGLVLEYFERSGKFENLATYSLRGLPRPWDDKYFPERRYSDPIFAVWGKNKLKNC